MYTSVLPAAVLAPANCTVKVAFLLFLIWFGVSFMYMLELTSDALIFVCGPCSAGKNLAWMSAGLGYLSFTATSRVSRKYGSWSIAQGIRHGMLDALPKICGKELEKEGAAWMDAKWILPMLSLQTRVRFPDLVG